VPEERSWPGERYDRCHNYNYVCSAIRTKAEEQTTIIDVVVTDDDGQSSLLPISSSHLETTVRISGSPNIPSVLPSPTLGDIAPQSDFE